MRKKQENILSGLRTKLESKHSSDREKKIAQRYHKVSVINTLIDHLFLFACDQVKFFERKKIVRSMTTLNRQLQQVRDVRSHSSQMRDTRQESNNESKAKLQRKIGLLRSDLEVRMCGMVAFDCLWTVYQVVPKG